MRRCVWSWNLVNKEALPHWGLSSQKQTNTRTKKRKVTCFSGILGFCFALLRTSSWRTYLTTWIYMWGSGGAAPLILNLKTGLWRVVSFTPRPPYSRGKRPPYTLNRRLGGPQTVPGSLWGQISLPVLRTGSHFLDCPAHSLVTISNKLSWIHDMKPEETLNLRILQYIVQNYTYLGTKTTKTNKFKWF